jgi:hypothetical protein
VQIKKRCKHSNVKLQRPSLATCQNQSQWQRNHSKRPTVKHNEMKKKPKA